MMVKYQSRKGEEFNIEYKQTITPGTHPWYLFEVRENNRQSTRAVMAREVDLMMMRNWNDYSDSALYELVLLRLQIALEKAEPDDPKIKEPRPNADFHHVLKLPDGVRPMADAMAALRAQLETARRLVD